MATRVIYCSSGDGVVSSSSATYSTARAFSGGTLAADTSEITYRTPSSAFTILGQQFSTPNFFCNEAFLSFPTNGISSVSSATLSMATGSGAMSSADDFNTLQARLHDWGGTLETSDAVAGASLSGKTLLATIDAQDVAANTYVGWADVALAANVNSSGATRILLCSSRTVAGSAPIDGNLHGFAFQTTRNTLIPKLTIVDSTTQDSQTLNGGDTTFTPTVTGTHDLDLWGAGGKPAAAAGQEGGAGGGAYSFAQYNVTSLSNVTVQVPNTQTTDNTAGDDAWFGSSSAPDPLAKGGGSVAIATGGAASGGRGIVEFNGGNGAAAQGGGGSRGGSGGGSSAGTAAIGGNGTAGSGSTAGVGGTAPAGGGNGGGGGAGGGGAGVSGTVPGGGAGGGGNTGNAGNGAAGKIIVYWYVASGPTTFQKAITVTQAQSNAMKRAAGHRVVPLLAQSVSIIESPTHPKIITFAMAQTVTLLRAMTRIKIISPVQAMAVVVRLAMGRRVTFSQSQTIILASAIARKITLTLSNAVTVTRTIGHKITLTLANAAAVTANFVAGGGTSFPATISSSHGQVVTLRLADAKLIISSIAQSVLARRAIGHRIISTLINIVTERDEISHRITLALANTVTVSLSVGHRITLTLANVISATANFVAGGGTSFPATVTLTQTQSVTLTRSVAKLIISILGQLIIVRRAIGRAVATALGQSIVVRRVIGRRIILVMTNVETVVGNFVAAGGSSFNKILNIFQPQEISGAARGQILLSVLSDLGLFQNITASAEKAAGSTTSKPISVTMAQIVALRRAMGKRITILQAQLISVRRALGRRVNIVQAQIINVYKVASRLIIITQAQNVIASAVKAAGATTEKVISIVQSQSIILRRAMSRLIVITQGQDVSGTAFADIARVIFQGIGLTQNVTVSAIKAAGATTEKTISVIQAQTIILRRALSKLILLTQAQLITARRFIGRSINIVQAQVVNLYKASPKLIIIMQAQNVIASAVKAAGATTQKTISVLQSQVVTLFRSIARVKLITIVQAQIVLLDSAISKLVSVIQSQLVTMRRAMGKRITILQGYSLTFSSGGALTFQRAYTIAQGQSVLLASSVRHIIVVLIGQSITIIRAISRLVIIVQFQLVTLARSFAKNWIVTITQAQVVTLAKLKAGYKLINVSIGEAVTLLRRTSKIIALISVNSVRVIRTIRFKIIIVGIGQTISLFTSAFGIVFRTIHIQTGQTISIFYDIFQRIKRKITTRRGGRQDDIRPMQQHDVRSTQHDDIRIRNNLERD